MLTIRSFTLLLWSSVVKTSAIFIFILKLFFRAIAINLTTKKNKKKLSAHDWIYGE